MKLNLCAGLGLFCALSAVVLMIFAEISQISDSQKVPRVIRYIYIDTTNFGASLASSGVDTSSLYGTGKRTGDGQGLRQAYEWGLWSRCAANSKGSSKDDWCDTTNWGYRFEPLNSLMSDVPTALRTDVLNALPNNVFTDDDYLGRYSHVAFYLLFVGALLAGLGYILGFMAHRFAFLLSALSSFFAFLCLVVGISIWTALVVRVRHAINGQGIGIHASYGNALWITWAAVLATLLSILPFLLACCTGRSRREEEVYDEKY